MDIITLKQTIDSYNNCSTDRSWTKSEEMLIYENDYIKVLRIDSSNKWTGQDSMIKMWSVIYEEKKDFVHLQKFFEISSIIDIEITPVKQGVLKGNYGIRIRNMKREPNAYIIKIILDFIFS